MSADISIDTPGPYDESALADIGAPPGNSTQLASEYLHTIDRLELT